MAVTILYGTPTEVRCSYKGESGKAYKTWEECFSVETNIPPKEVENSDAMVVQFKSGLTIAQFVCMRESYQTSEGNQAYGVDPEKFRLLLLPPATFRVNMYSWNKKLERFCAVLGLEIRNTIGWYALAPMVGQGHEFIQPSETDLEPIILTKPEPVEKKPEPEEESPESKKSGWKPLEDDD